MIRSHPIHFLRYHIQKENNRERKIAQMTYETRSSIELLGLPGCI